MGYKIIRITHRFCLAVLRKIFLNCVKNAIVVTVAAIISLTGSARKRLILACPNAMIFSALSLSCFSSAMEAKGAPPAPVSAEAPTSGMCSMEIRPQGYITNLLSGQQWLESLTVKTVLGYCRSPDLGFLQIVFLSFFISYLKIFLFLYYPHVGDEVNGRE